jgi:exosortase
MGDSWRDRLLSMVAFGLFFSYFFSVSMGNMYRAWQLPQGYDHGPLVALLWLLGVLVLTRRTVGAATPVFTKRSAATVFFAIVLIGFFSKVAEKFSVETVQYFAVTAFLLISVWYLYRPKDTSRFILLSVILISGVPIWDIAILVLQPLTIGVSDAVLTALKVPVLFSGSLVMLPSGTFEIAEGCAGLRFLLAALAFSASYAFLYIKGNRNRFLFIAATCLLSVVSNLFRVVSIIWMGYYTEIQSSLVRDHYSYGWIIFCVALIPSLWLGFKIRDSELQNEAA